MSAQALLIRVRPTLILGAVVVLAAGSAACSDDRPTAARIPADDLPTAQAELGYDLCPNRKELQAPAVRRTRAAARRQVERLADAYRDDPEALVRTSFLPSNSAGREFEQITVRKLVESHVAGASEVIEVGDRSAQRCARRLRARLTALLDE